MSEQREEDVVKSDSIRWIIRPMKHEDIERCLSIWSRVELTEAYETVASCLTVNPNGFVVAELAEDGKLVGMCAAAMTRMDTAFMGFYAVEPEYQRMGIGRELWSASLNSLDEHVNVGLYGVPAMSEKYKKSGFSLEDSIKMLVFESGKDADLSGNLSTLRDIEELIGCRLVVIDGNSSEILFKKLVDYDHSVQKFSRERLLRTYLRGESVPLTLAIVKDHSRGLHSSYDHQHHVPQVYTGERKSSYCAKPSQEAIIEDEALSTTIKSCLSLSATNLGDLSPSMRSTSPIDIPSIVSSAQQTHHHDSIIGGASRASGNESDGAFDILGYGCIRLDNNSGGIIGPIYADSSDLCEVLLRNLMEQFNLESGRIFSAMALSSNKHSSRLLLKAGLNEIDQCSRNFTKFIPAASFSKIYYVHSPNFTLF